jgi:tRNA dimethylallyltransferase
LNSQSSGSLPPAICLVGPTACGKTRAAVELVQAGAFGIISVDSALVYRGLDIGSGKPDAVTLAQAPHRLLDIRDPSESYSAADFRHDAIMEMSNVVAAGKTPLLVGGTMLYFKALRDGLAVMPSATPEIRQRIEAFAAREGWAAVHARLAAVDPKAAARIHPNDPQRLQRALEVYEVSGRSLSELHAEQSQGAQQKKEGQAGQASDLPCELIFIGMIPTDRSALHQIIAARFHEMLVAGLVDEVKALRARGDLVATLPSIRSVGYRQVWEFLEGRYDYDTMIEKSIVATRQLAKRQLTWLRSWSTLHQLECSLTSKDAIFVKNYLKKMGLVAIY